MSIHTERLRESIHQIATESILSHMREYDHPHGIVSVVEVRISPDKQYADVFTTAQHLSKELPRLLAPLASVIHKRISTELWLRKTPRIRFREQKSHTDKKDILQTIQELDAQYGLSQ